MAAFPLQPGMADILDNPAGKFDAPVPQNPQEVDGRKKAWQHVLDDPNVKSSILRMGLNLMQGREEGENLGGAIGRTGLDAMDFYGFKTEQDRKRAIDERALQLDERQGEASINRDVAATEASKQDTAQKKVEFTEWEAQANVRKQKAEQEVKNLITQGKTAEAQALKTSYEADELKRFQAFKDANPDAVDASFEATLKLPTAELGAVKARANASNASAAASMESVKDSREGRTAKPAWIAAMPDDEAQLYAMAHKDSKTQSQINTDIALGLHKNITSKNDPRSADDSGFEGMADSLITMYNALDPKEKSRYSSFDDWVTQTKQATVGKSLGSVLRIANQKLATGGGAAPAASTAPPAPPAGQRVEGQVYQTPRGDMKWTKDGWIK